MTSQVSNNRRIAKNTLYLYIRMLILMCISIYTSRIFLQALGVTDYGIYNVVGGVVAMLSVLSNSMSSSTQRFLTFELGRNNLTNLRYVFNTSMLIYFLLAVLFLFISETIGLWFVNNKLVIPHERITAANWVYQYTILSCIFTLLMTPYNSSIVAHEKMNIYAYLTILTGVMKLVIAFVLLFTKSDKLIMYGGLFCLSSIITTLLYRKYCIMHFEECHIEHKFNKETFYSLFSFSTWSLFGSISNLVNGEGINILLNLFFGPVVNASSAIASQLCGIVGSLYFNFYSAVIPQVTKYYAQGAMKEMYELVIRSSKFSFYLILLVSLPLLLETSYILNLWLGQTPKYSVSFSQLTILYTVFEALSQPLNTVSNSTGKVKRYQITMGLLTISNLPISYLFLEAGCMPSVVLIISIIISIICFLCRIWLLCLTMDFPIIVYLKETIFKTIIVSCVSAVLPVVIYINTENNMTDFIFVVSSSIFCSLISIWFIGINYNERQTLIQYAKIKLSKFNY